MADLGYDTHNAVLVLGSMGIFVLIYYFKLLLNLALKPIKNKKVQKLRSKYSKSLFFSEILSIVMEGYIEFLIAQYLNLSLPLDSKTGEVISLIFTFSTMFLTWIFVPVVIFWTMAQSEDTLREKSFQEKWGPIYEGLNLRKSGSLGYPLIFILRRIIFLGVCFFLQEDPTF